MNRKRIVSLRTFASLAAEERKRQDRERALLVAFVVVAFGYFGAHLVVWLFR